MAQPLETRALRFYAVGRYSRQRLPTNLGVLFVPQQEGWVVQRFGKFKEVLEPGLRVLIPFVDKVAYRHSLKVRRACRVIAPGRPLASLCACACCSERVARAAARGL
jgi:hypothetical protein